MTIQMKPFQQYFHMVLFIQYIVLTFVSVEIKNLIESSSKGFSDTIYDDINPINIKLLKL